MVADTRKLRVYGIDIELSNAEDLAAMNEQELYETFVMGHLNEIESYGLDYFFCKLNSDEIDTENKFWFVARA